MSLIDSFQKKKQKKGNSSDEGDLHELAKKRYLNYAMSVITDRALPDVRDGLKPVQRRILHAMFSDLRLTASKKHRKSAAVVGEVMGKYHPHGDCLRGNTKIYLANGEEKTMKELYEESSSVDIWCVDSEGNPICAEAHSFRIGQKTNKIYSLRLSNGETLEVTGNHPILSEQNEWVKASYIEEGFSLYSSRLRGYENRPYLYMNFNPSQSSSLQEIAAKNNGDRPEGFVIHHKDENPKNNKPENLEYMSRAEHAKHHEDYLEGLKNGRKEMFEDGGFFKEKTEEKNSYMMSKWNEKQGVYKAIRLIKELDKRGLQKTKANYKTLRDSDEFYNYPLIHKMKERGQIEEFQDLIQMEKAYESYIEEAYSKNHSRGNSQKSRNLDFVEKGHEKRIFDVFSKSLKEGLGFNKEGYSKARQTLINENGQGWGNIHERNYPKVSTIGERFEDLVDKFKKKRPYVENVQVIEVEQEPMYDFTVDHHENMMVVVGQDDKEKILAPVHNSSIYNAMVRLAQDFNTRMPLVDGHGNFGSIDGDNPAAMRYTEARLRKVTSDLLEDLGYDAVDWKDNYDSTTQEPAVLPVRAPIALINGAIGIAVGFATHIPPHNITEVLDATIDLIDNPNRRVSTLVKNHIKGPDFPTGGVILEDEDDIIEMYKEGSGTVHVRAVWDIEKERGRKNIVITEIPYNVKKQDVVEDIAQNVLDNNIPQVRDVRDESTKDIRIVLELKKNADIDAVMAWMFKNTRLQESVHANLTCLVPEDDILVPRQLDLKSILEEYIKFQLNVILRRCKHELGKIEDRIEILEGYEMLFQDVDRALEIVTGSKNKSAAQDTLISEFGMNKTQALAVLNSRIYQLIQKEKDEILDELKEKRDEADHLNTIISDEDERRSVLKDQLREVRKAHGEDRRTAIDAQVKDLEFDEANYIEEEKVYVIASENGLIRRQRSYGNLDTLRVKDNDEIKWVLAGNTREVALFFTSIGRCYTARIDDLPDTTGYGDPIQSMFDFANGERIVNVLTTNEKVIGKGDPKEKELVCVTSDGSAIRFNLHGYLKPSTVRGRRFMNVSDGQQALNACLVRGDEDRVVLATYQGKGITFKPEKVSFVKGAAKGVAGIRLASNDRVIAYELCGPKQYTNLTVITSRDAERSITENTYKTTNRGNSGYEILQRGTLDEWRREIVEINK